MFRTPHYEGWEDDIIWQLADLFESAIGAPKALDVRHALAEYPPVHVIYARPRISQCRDLVDWNSVRPALVCTAAHQNGLTWTSELMHTLDAPF